MFIMNREIEEVQDMERKEIGNSGSVLYEQNSSHCIVLLPGFGYLFDRPLLAEMKELALQKGFNVLELSFGELPYDKTKMKESVEACVPLAAARAKATLEQLMPMQFHFVAKSFGTIIACMLRKSYTNQPAVLLTPLKQTIPLIETRDVIAYGDEDPFLDEEDLSALSMLDCKTKIFCPGANHSLLHASQGLSAFYLADVKDEMQRFLDEIS